LQALKLGKPGTRFSRLETSYGLAEPKPTKIVKGGKIENVNGPRRNRIGLNGEKTRLDNLFDTGSLGGKPNMLSRCTANPTNNGITPDPTSGTSRRISMRRRDEMSPQGPR
jgi:hypothetical protein